MKAKRWLALFCVLSCLTATFIFCQSLQSAEGSAAHSGRLAALLQQLLDRQRRIPEETFHLAVRKLAHFTEFAVLGLCVGGAAVNVYRLRQRRYYAFPVLLTLLVALTDECIQHFTGRSSQVWDVVLDLAGALFGLAAALVIAYAGAWAKRKLLGRKRVRPNSASANRESKQRSEGDSL